MIPGLARREIDACADQGVRNSQPEGIGRVVALDDLVAWNNLGRNVVFADRTLRPRAVFGTTVFPGEDEPSQYDLDIHAILDFPESGAVEVLNHLGALRRFRRADLAGPSYAHRVEPASWRWFVADVERTVGVAGRLVAAAPRSEGALGVVVSVPLDTVPDQQTIPTRLCASPVGEVTALGVVPLNAGPLLAVGGVSRLALVALSGGQLGPALWEVDTGFRVATVAWSDGLLWASGPDCDATADDYDWERLKGGGFVVLDPADGRSVMGGPLPDDVAWGTGGVPVAPFGRFLAAAGRTGCLHLIDPSGATVARSIAGRAARSLGIAHLAVVGAQVLCGFNRGGYRLDLFSQGASVGEEL